MTGGTTDHPTSHNQLIVAVNDIVGVLGSGPQGTYADTTARLSALTNSDAAKVTGVTAADVTIVVGGTATAPTVRSNRSPQVSLAGTAGTALSSQPFQGATYKKFMVYLNGYTNTAAATITFPTAFVVAPYFAIQPTGFGATTTVTTLTLPITSTATTGFIVLEGY